MWKTSSVPSLFEYCVSTMLRMHMRWHYVFWGDKDISALFASRAPQIGRNFNNYGLTGLQTSDVARYLIVYVYGGFYVDLDMEAIKPLDPLLDSSQLILGQEPRAHGFFLYGGRKRVACNAIIGSEHSFKFWEIVLNNVKLVGGADAVSTTGPLRLDAIVSQYGFDSYVKEPRLFYPLVGPTAYSKVLQYCDQSAGATWAQRMYHARIMDPCFDYIDEAGHFPNRLTNYSYTAHHWSHTNLNPPECDDNKKKGAMTNTVDIARILRRATWIEVGNPHRRPISENPLDQLITCASTTPPEMRRQYHHHH